MWRITFFTTDKKLHIAQKAMVGLAVGRPEVDWITDAVGGKNGARSNPLDMAAFFGALPPQFRTKDMAAALKAQDRAHNTGYVHQTLKRGIKEKLIKRKAQGIYTRISK